MARTFAAAGLLAVAMASGGSDLYACGDKSLSAGGIRMQRALAARYPASILIYAPPSSRLQEAAHELRLQETLRQVGHKYRDVTSLPDLQTAAATGQFNVVIADLADIPELQRTLGPSSARVAVVAVAYRLTKQETATAAKIFRLLIKVPTHAADYLRTIADAVRTRPPSPRKA